MKHSALKGTFFEHSHLSIFNIIQLSYWFVTNRFTQAEVASEVGVSIKTVSDWFSFCREVVDHYCIEHTVQVGGPDKVVEIDEAKFGKRKYNCGRVIDGQWLFGGFERESKRFFMVPVPDRTRETLLKEIKKYILPGTKIISDCWKAYEGLNKEGYLHETVNHSLNFVDPDTGASTQNIERSWREARANIPTYGRKDNFFQLYLSVHFFIRAFPNHKECLHQFFVTAAELYPGVTA